MRNLRFCCAFYFPEPSESIALRASEEQSQQLSVILLPASRQHMTFYAKPSHGFHPFITPTRSQQLTANAIVIQCKRCGDFLKDWIIEYSIEQVNSRQSSLCEELDMSILEMVWDCGCFSWCDMGLALCLGNIYIETLPNFSFSCYSRYWVRGVLFRFIMPRVGVWL